MDLGIKGKRALVLAGGGGLGSAIAACLADEGATVVIADADGEAAIAARQRVIDAGGCAHAIQWDLADLSIVQQQVDACMALAGGPFDILINNTGGPPPAEASGIRAADWKTYFESMVLSVVFITDALLPSMKQRKWGRVITSTSSGVIAPIRNLALSNSLRSSLVGWSKTLAGEVGAFGVTVNVVVPGRIATQRIRQLDESKAAREGTSVRSVQEQSTASIPLRRYGEPVEYARAVTFLASEAASYITGSTLRVDGGLVPSI